MECHEETINPSAGQSIVSRWFEPEQRHGGLSQCDEGRALDQLFGKSTAS